MEGENISGMGEEERLLGVGEYNNVLNNSLKRARVSAERNNK